MSHHLTATFHLFILFIIFFFDYSFANQKVDFLKPCHSLQECNQTANFICVIPRFQCECKLGFLPNSDKNACVEALCNENPAVCQNIRNTECVHGKCKCFKEYINDYTYNECVIPPNHTTLFVVIGCVVGVLVVATIVGVFVWRYKRTQKQNSKTFHFQSGGGDELAMQAPSQNMSPQTNQPNDHQTVFSTDDSFAAFQQHQQHQLPTGHQPVYSTPTDFPPPYTVEDYGGPSTSYANPNPNPAVLASMQQAVSLEAPGNSSNNPYSPIASNKLTLL